MFSSQRLEGTSTRGDANEQIPIRACRHLGHHTQRTSGIALSKAPHARALAEAMLSCTHHARAMLGTRLSEDTAGTKTDKIPALRGLAF